MNNEDRLEIYIYIWINAYDDVYTYYVLKAEVCFLWIP